MSKIADDREWLDARLEQLAAEKTLQKTRDRVREERRQLPWRPVRQEYVFHTYSTCSRGLDPFNVTCQFLDIVPSGRNEDELPYPMEWVRRHDQYA